MITITREELKAKLEQGGDFKLVNCLDDWMFRAKRIPGSIRFESLKHALDTLNPKEEVIVYCSNSGCTASVLVYQQLIENGFQNLTRYAGGIADWEDAGIRSKATMCIGLNRNHRDRFKPSIRLIVPV